MLNYRKVFNIIGHSAQNDYSMFYEEWPARYIIPSTGITLAHSNSIVILPRIDQIVQLIDFYEFFFGERINILWTEDKYFMLDEELYHDTQLTDELNKISSYYYDKGFQLVVRPYSYNKYFKLWMQRLPKLNAICESESNTKKYRYKNIFYRHIRHMGKSNFIDYSNHLLIPKGFICDDTYDLLEAYNCLSSYTENSLLIKPINGLGGVGFSFVSSISDIYNYKFAYSDSVILSEFINVDINPFIKNEVNCSIEFIEGKILGPPTTQIIKNFEWIGGISPTIENEEFIKHALYQSKIILKYLIKNKILGVGGIDFIGKGNKAYLIDNNLTRETGSHFPKYFQNKYAKSSAFCCLELSNSTKSIYEIWDLLTYHKLGFSLNKGTGIFPLVYLPSIASIFISFDEDGKKAFDKLMDFNTLI
ncbi:hypothetical protein [uncultured Desulfobacter sp.]|uniref:hypothetical protein n=1 Tax=uncultured Desulfobacter sp. TaxID=240139 RepID=UPI002AABB34C|nr:hypothetical protein [uncultured Desulfobacter sp.]